MTEISTGTAGGVRVGLSVDALSSELTGIGRYCWELVSRLPNRLDVEAVSFWRGRRLVLQPEELLRPPPAAPLPPWRNVLHRGARALDLRHKAIRRFEKERIDIFHAPNFMLPPWVERGVVTIHDLSVFRHPETHPIERVAAYESDFAASLSRCSHIITPSHTVREEVIQFTGTAPERVTAVPMGVGGHFRPLSSEQRNPVLHRLGLPISGYGLTVSALEPRKRIERLLAAWRLLPIALRNRWPLVVAGAAGWRNETLQAAMEEGAKESWVIPLPFVPEADLPALYSGAALFVYPSLYEGFGLPPIEAMACGVPTIVANASCLPEVTAGAAMLVEPDDVAGFVEALARGLEDAHWRQAATMAGLAVASGYSWEACIERTVEVYRRQTKM